MKRNSNLLNRAFVLAAVVVVLGAPLAMAIPVSIVSYDITDTPLSGHGNWAHNYFGAIAPTGVNFNNDGGGIFPGSLANYTGGSGTLNDGVIGNSVGNTQLFVGGVATDGTVINPTITLHLGGSFAINSISIFGGDGTGNLIPGRLSSLDVDLGGGAMNYNTTPFGAPMGWGGQQDDLITIGGGQLGQVTNTIVLSNVSALESGGYFDWFSITEIQIDGTPVPEPATLLLMGFGLAGLGLRRRWNA